MNVNQVTDYIRQAAIARGIDPDIAVRVARSEGLAEGVWQSNNREQRRGREPSYGPFQLLVGGQNGWPTGMGNDFIRRTGLDPSDPSTVNAQIDFALDGAAKNGWGAWYGAAKAGIGNRDGIGGARAIGVNTDTNFMAQTQPVPSSAPARISTPTQFPPAELPAVLADNQAPFMAQNGEELPPLPPPRYVGAHPATAAQIPPAPTPGLLDILTQPEGPKMSDFKAFMGDKPRMESIGAGLNMLAQGSARSAPPQVAPPPIPIDTNAPDLSLLAMLDPKRKRGIKNGFLSA